jgi:peptide/nickel transport system permease protein
VTTAIEVRGDVVGRERQGFWTRWYRTSSFVAGLAILGVLALMAVLAPVLSQHDPNAQDLLHTLAPPSSRHWLGTDQLGRDVWARLLYAGRIDLSLGVLAIVLPFVSGTVLGCIAGFYGRWADTIVMRVSDIVIALPFYVMVLALVFVLGAGVTSIFIAIAWVGWVAYARLVRAEILVAKQQDYFLAARAGGLSDLRIIWRHLIPNVIPQAVVYAMSDVLLAILAIVTLGYFGLGVPPPTPDWGAMIADGQQFLTTKWDLSVIPGVAVVITGLGLSLIGDGLADLMRPE